MPCPPDSSEVDLLRVYKEEGLFTRWADSASGGPHNNNPYFSANGGDSDE